MTKSQNFRLTWVILLAVGAFLFGLYFQPDGRGRRKPPRLTPEQMRMGAPPGMMQQRAPGAPNNKMPPQRRQ